jgi:DNA-directed RNA polymerase specialized sigma24 family protein
MDYSSEHGDSTADPKRHGTAEELQSFLDRLSHNSDEAGQKYNRIHQKLVVMFEGYREAAPHAVELADAAIDRIVRLLNADRETAIQNIDAYARTVGKYILMEHRKKKTRELSMEDVPEPPAPEEQPDIRLMCLTRCLDRLPPADRELVLRYYEHEKSEKIADRQDAAATSNLSAVALRVRVYRIRRSLEKCIEAAMKSPFIGNILRKDAT